MPQNDDGDYDDSMIKAEEYRRRIEQTGIKGGIASSTNRNSFNNSGEILLQKPATEKLWHVNNLMDRRKLRKQGILM